MASEPVVQPIGQTHSRLPTHGRIRTGVNTGKFPKSLSTFRFTSPDQTAIEKLAAIYGSQEGPRKWKNAKANPPEQWELISDSNVIGVVIVPASVEVSYESWGNGFRKRSCDGVTVLGRRIVGKGKDRKTESQTMPCLCNANSKLECNPVTRLNVLLPEIPFRGTWLMQSSGWNVFHEMPAMAEMTAMMKPGEMIKAQLALEKRQSDGGSRKYVVPVIRLDESFDQMSMPTTAEPDAIEAAPAADPLAALEEEIIDAEIVED